jgi:hypothetical protein
MVVGDFVMVVTVEVKVANEHVSAGSTHRCQNAPHRHVALLLCQGKLAVANLHDVGVVEPH